MNKFALCLAAAAVFAIPSSDAQASFGFLFGGHGNNCNSCDSGCGGGGCGLFSCFKKKSCCRSYDCCQPTCCETTCCQPACDTCHAAPACDTCHAAPSCCGATPSCCGGDHGHSYEESAPTPPADHGPMPTPAVAPAPPAAE
jgi:hypothetical protein